MNTQPSYSRPIFLSLTIALIFSACSGQAAISDKILFGTTLDSSNNRCSEQFVLNTTFFELVEDGNEAWNAKIDPDSGLYWGNNYKERKVCIQLKESFTSGSVTIPTSVVGDQTRFTITPPLPSSISFDETNTNTDQCFIVKVVEDHKRTYTSNNFKIYFGKAEATGDAVLGYDGKKPCDVGFTIEDAEGPGAFVSSMDKVIKETDITPNVDKGKFQVKLRLQPTDDVTIPLNDLFDSKNSGHREGKIFKADCTTPIASLTFTPANFSTFQDVCVVGQRDWIEDGAVQWVIELKKMISNDSDYSGLKPRNVTVITSDVDTVGYEVKPLSGANVITTSSQGATISKMATDDMSVLGSNYANFEIRLRSKPKEPVTLNFAVANTDGSANSYNDAIFDGASSFTFTQANWNVFQQVKVKGSSNNANEGNHDYKVVFTTSTTDPSYNTIPKPDFLIRSCDNDGSNMVQRCELSGMHYDRLTVRESNTTPTTDHTWYIGQRLPTDTVTCAATTTDATEGTVSNIELNSSNYNKLENSTNRLTLTAVDDNDIDGTQNYNINVSTCSSSDAGYNVNVTPNTTIAASTQDDENPYEITQTGTTKEATPSQTATLKIRLKVSAEDGAPVTIKATCTSANSNRECGTINNNGGGPNNQVTFGGGDTTTVYTFTFTGGDDQYSDGNQDFSIKLEVVSGASPFDLVPPGSHTFTNEDNEPPAHAVFIATTTQTGEMSGLGGVDSSCNDNRVTNAPAGSYKALIVDNSTRIATIDGTTATGQVGWVIQPNHHYYLCGSNCSGKNDENSRIFIANSAGLISELKKANGVGQPFSTDLNDKFWTGMNGNMTTSTTGDPGPNGADPAYRMNCAGWTYVDGPTNPNNPYYGQYWKGNTTDLNTITGGAANGPDALCSNSYKLICIEQ
ncbi:MAG: DUF1554 domain-containing protein [Leptonema sp. (in: Bacteria)]|nr:DUF1554 domain-containing protein [Leptonema sp. (in: bacteria)]